MCLFFFAKFEWVHVIDFNYFVANLLKSIFFPFYCILSFGVHVQDMQDSCIGTHLVV